MTTEHNKQASYTAAALVAAAPACPACEGRPSGENIPCAVCKSTPAAPGIDLVALREIASDLSHSAKVDDYMPPQQIAFIESIRDRLLALIDASPKGGSEGDDAALLDWMDANGFTAYRQIDPIDGLSRHCVVVAEAVAPRHGNVHDAIRGAIRAAMQAQAGDAAVRHV